MMTQREALGRCVPKVRPNVSQKLPKDSSCCGHKNRHGPSAQKPMLTAIVPCVRTQHVWRSTNSVAGMSVDEQMMRQVLALARLAQASGNHPFGAALSKDGRFLEGASDRSVSENDPTYHAELSLIQQYCRTNELLSLEGLTLYSNVEPCPMCAGAIYYAGVSRLVFSVSRTTFYSLVSRRRGIRPRNYTSSASIINDKRSRIEIVGGVLEAEGINLLSNYEFFSKVELRRQMNSKGDRPS